MEILPCGIVLLIVIKTFSFTVCIAGFLNGRNDLAAEKSLDVSGFSVPAAGPRGYDVVVALGELFLAVSECGADYPAAAASCNSVADLLACGYPKTCLTRAILFVINGNIFTDSIFAVLIQADESFVFLDFNSIFHLKSLNKKTTKRQAPNVVFIWYLPRRLN